MAAAPTRAAPCESRERTQTATPLATSAPPAMNNPVDQSADVFADCSAEALALSGQTVPAQCAPSRRCSATMPKAAPAATEPSPAAAAVTPAIRHAPERGAGAPSGGTGGADIAVGAGAAIGGGGPAPPPVSRPGPPTHVPAP